MIEDMKTNDIPLPQLLTLIEKYFDCSLTDAEEARLRIMVATTSYSHPAIDEAKAVMGLRHNANAGSRKHNARKSWVAVTGVAAAVAVAVTLAIHFMLTPGVHSVDSTCIAYIDGKMVTDEDAVIRQLQSDMREFGDCALEIRQAVRDEIEEAIPVIDIYESQPLLTEN